MPAAAALDELDHAAFVMRSKLAALELAKRGRLEIAQEDAFAPISLKVAA